MAEARGFLSLDVDRRCVVAASGFTKRARKDAERYGVELRTVSEIGLPNWWCAEQIEGQTDQVEIIDVRLNYKPTTPQESIRAVEGMNARETSLILPTGARFTLEALALHYGLETIGKPEADRLADQSIFTVAVLMRVPEGSFLEGSAGQMPVPESMVATYRLHRSTEASPVVAFEMGGAINAFTVLQELLGKQLTLVSELQGDGSRRFSLSFADAAPKRTRVERVANNVDSTPKDAPARSRSRCRPEP